MYEKKSVMMMYLKKSSVGEDHGSSHIVGRSLLYIVAAVISLLALLFMPGTGALATAKTVQSGSTSGSTTPPVRVIAQGRTDLPMVALTFDDGPNPMYTPQILGILAQYNVHATFFEVGQQVQQYPALSSQVVQAGNVVGDHTWDHPSLTNIPPAQQTSEIERASAAIKAASGTTPTLLRPPYGNTNLQVETVTAEQHMTTVLWSVDTVDWSRPGVQSIVNTALNNAHDGSIILLHDGGGDRSETVAALPSIIKGLQARHYQLATVPNLIADLYGQSAVA
jgi:Predicted xylanase/chitin deacetylase